MNFSGVTPGDLISCLRTNRLYNKYIQDTEEAIDKLNEDLRNRTDLTEGATFDWFLNNLKMAQKGQYGSLYRAFLCLQTDEIFNLRIANHNSTIMGTKDSWRKYGKPDIEYQLILEKVPLVHTNATPLEEDTLVLGTPILVNEYSVGEFCDPSKRGGLIDEIIDILENGSSGNARIQRVQNECLYIRKEKDIVEVCNWLFEQMETRKGA